MSWRSLHLRYKNKAEIYVDEAFHDKATFAFKVGGEGEGGLGAVGTMY